MAVLKHLFNEFLTFSLAFSQAYTVNISLSKNFLLHKRIMEVFHLSAVMIVRYDIDIKHTGACSYLPLYLSKLIQ